MFNHVMFFVYIFAAFVGFSVAALLYLVVRARQRNNTESFYAMLLFVVCSVLIGSLYFIEMYTSDLHNIDARNALMRVLDITLYLGQAFFWFRYIRSEMIHTPRSLRKLTNTTLSILAVASAVSYTFFVDELYFIAPGLERTAGLVIQSLVCVILVVLKVAYIVSTVKNVSQRKSRIYIIVVTLVTMANGLWNGIITLGLMMGKYEITTLNEQLYDPTAVLLFLSNLITLVYVYNHDFSAIYLNHENPDSKVDELANQYNLTAREKEVVRLLYDGESYADIAEALSISKHTVKRHVHNIYEKTGISTKIDLINTLK